VRTPAWKLLIGQDGSRLLYELERDPGEHHPRPPRPEESREAEEALARFLERYTSPLYAEQARSVRPEELSPEVIEKLRGLGYVE
jgi:hypothetical protein